MAHVCFLHENWGLPTTSLGETDTLDKVQFFSDRSQDCYPDLNQALKTGEIEPSRTPEGSAFPRLFLLAQALFVLFPRLESTRTRWQDSTNSSMEMRCGFGCSCSTTITSTLAPSGSFRTVTSRRWPGRTVVSMRSAVCMRITSSLDLTRSVP